MSPVLPIVIFVLVAAGVIYLIFWLEKKRTSAWQGIAQRLGADLVPKGSTVHNRFPFDLFNKGSRRKAKNHLQWESEGVTVHLVDYQYTVYSHTGRNRSSKTYKRTICILEKEGLDLPRTFIRRQIKVLDWVGSKFGAQDIDFQEDPEFSKAFVVKGDEVRTPQILTHELRQHLLQNKKNFRTVEMNGNAIMLNFGKRRKPEEYSELVSLAMPVYYMASSGGSAW